MTDYHVPPAGLPPQTRLMDPRAVFTNAYAFIPGSTVRDITASALPGWTDTRLWIIARPMTGFAETFSHYLMEVAPGGGSTAPEPNPQAQGALFVTGGAGHVTVAGDDRKIGPGSYVYIPAGTAWSLRADDTLTFHWLRKRYVPAPGLDAPDPIFASDADTPPTPMPDTNDVWATTRFVDPADLRHDMHVTIVTFQPGGVIPFPETHVMEHGLYVLEGKAVYRLNQDWVEVEAGDYMWLRAFCPQACYAGGPGPFRYLLYKDVNRHAALTL